MQPGAVAILPTAPEAARNSDSDYPYRHDSYFYYLTGFTEPDSVLVLVAAQRRAAGAGDPVLPPEKPRARNLGRLPLRPRRRARSVRLRRRLPDRRPRCRDGAPAGQRAGGVLRARPQRRARPADEDLAAERAAPGAQRRHRARRRARPAGAARRDAPVQGRRRAGADAARRAPSPAAPTSARCAPRVPACSSTRSKPNCCTNSAAAAPSRRPTRRSSRPAPMPACCTTSPTTRKAATATWS